MTEMTNDYSHRFHVGNVGDVWKHCVLVASLDALTDGPPVRSIETHAGEGRYALGPTGEWTEGIGRLWDGLPTGAPDAATRYVELVRSLGHGGQRPRAYPGSPAFASAQLREGDSIVLYELADEAARHLDANLGGDPRVRVVKGDGLAALPQEIAERDGRAVFALIDPPYSSKPEWLAVPDALLLAYRARPDAFFMLWYPVKSLTRPNAMLERLRAGGMPGTTLELLTTPLDLKKKRLNGSGVVLVNPPPGLVERAAAAAPALGRACATHDGRWSTRALGW